MICSGCEVCEDVRCSFCGEVTSRQKICDACAMKDEEELWAMVLAAATAAAQVKELAFRSKLCKQFPLLEPDFVKAQVLQTPFPLDFVEHLLSATEIRLRDVCDLLGYDKGEGIQLLAFLVRKRALFRDGRTYFKGLEFTALLKSMRGSPEVVVLEDEL